MSEQELEATIRALMAKDAIEVAPFPAVAMKISALLRNENYGIGDLVKLVANDQALSARLLKVASSALYCGSEAVSSVQAAVARLGAKEVSSLALASQLGSQARGAGLLASLKRKIWQESIIAALVTQRLAVLRRQSPEDSFTCGLLHDFGRMVAVTAIEKILAGRPSVEAQPEQYWTRIVDKFHIELGTLVARRWNLSQLLHDVITMHHGHSTAACKNPQILEAVMVADNVIRLANASPAITAEGLQSVAGLRTPAERDLMVSTLPLCPPVIANFEVYEQAAATLPSAVTMAHSKEPLHALALDAVCGSKGGYRATGVGASVLILEGKAPLTINRLVQVSLSVPPRPVTLWMNPESCEAVGGSQRIELRPFALSGEAATAWTALPEQPGSSGAAPSPPPAA